MNDALQRAARARLSGGRARGFLSRVALLLFACAFLPSAHAQESVCAEVKIEIKQTVTLERQAFDARLKIRNGLSLPVEAIDVSLRFADADGVAVPATTNPDDNGGARFFFRTDGTTDITGELTGTGVVAPQKTGEAHWLIVPTASAGGQTPDGVAYRVGATITYRIGNETKTVEVTPDAITVKPQPKLRLDYFLTHDVNGDDPNTPQTEPIEPFTLGVRVWNYGYGRANAAAIESGQPRIIDNKLGLLVDFRILDGYVDDAPAQPTLALGFGEIGPGKAKMGRWNMTASLSGVFRSFTATLRHADEFGGALTSLIEDSDIKSHDLVRDVLADAPGRDGVRDFLARDVDVVHLFESDGGLVAGGTGWTAVSEATGGSLSGGGNTRALRIDAVPSGFVYARLADPFAGQMDKLEARRQDGKAIPAANVWFSKERNASATGWLYYINLFDFHDASLGGQVTYTLGTSTAPAQPASLRGSVYEDVDGDGAHGASEPAMFDVDITLAGTSDDGQAVERSARTDALGGFAFTGVPSGSYRLGVGAVAGYRNGLHAAGTAGGTVTDAEILGIALAAGANTGGYTFVKMQQGVVTRQADLAISDLSVWDTSRVVIGRPFTVRLVMRNDGPDDVPAAVRLVLPAGMRVNAATPSAGGFDDATNVWQVGPVPVGNTPTLQLNLTALALGTGSMQATVVVDDPQATDPQSANNYLSQQIVVNNPAEFRIDAAVDNAPRVLVLSTCVTDSGGPVELRASQTASDDDTCLFGRAIALDALFTSLDVPHFVAHGEAAFHRQLRSGNWNTYWIDAGAAKLLGDAANRELAQALLRGEWIIVDRPRQGDGGAPNAGAAKLEAYVPSALDTEGPEGQSVERVEVPDSPFLPAGFLAVGTEEGAVSSAYTLYRSLGTDAQDLAVFDMSPTLRPVALHRINRTLLFGFDFFSALTQASPGYREEAMRRLLGATRPASESVFETGSDIVFKGGITALDPINFSLVFRTPAGAVLGAVEPAADVAQPDYLNWRSKLGPQDSFGVSIGLHLPAEEAESLPLGFQVTSDDRDPDNVTSGGIAVAVRKSDTQAGELRTALGTLGATDAAAMRALLDQALVDYANRQYNVAIQKLLDISDAVDGDWRTNGSYAAPLARELGRLLLWWQRKDFWTPVESPPGTQQQRAGDSTGKKGDAAAGVRANPES